MAYGTDTVADIVRRSVRVELRQLLPAVYFPSHRSGPLDYNSRVSSIGLKNGSTVYTRWRLRGGASEMHTNEGLDASINDVWPYILTTNNLRF